MATRYKSNLARLVNSLTLEQAALLGAEICEDINANHFSATAKIDRLCKERIKNLSEEELRQLGDRTREQFFDEVF